LLVRYVKTPGGDTEELARIYTFEEHGIKIQYIDPDARKIIHRLVSHGFKAYIVGGAVRDLLIGRRPKDFDIVTDAHPGKIRKIFWNSRIIGRRFRLVHVYADDNILEVSTFRAADSNQNNTFGTMKEDVMRRDFSMNALYYDPDSQQLYDYVGGLQDILEKKIETIIPLETIFKDDPVRIIRIIRYAAITGFPIRRKLARQIKTDRRLLRDVSNSRLTEEVMKILQSGKSERIFSSLFKYEISEDILPEIHRAAEEGTQLKIRMLANLRKLDRNVRKYSAVTKSEMITAVSKDYVEERVDWENNPETVYKEVFRRIKQFITPITPPNKDVEQAVRGMFKSRGMRPPFKKRYKMGRQRSRRPGGKSGASKQGGKGK
jgi:poly(A) polymerase